MTRRFAKHNIVGNEVGKALTFEFPRDRWPRRRHGARRRRLWLGGLLLALGVAVFTALRAVHLG
jgi:hypothetical protein